MLVAVLLARQVNGTAWPDPQLWDSVFFPGLATVLCRGTVTAEVLTTPSNVHEALQP